MNLHRLRGVSGYHTGMADLHAEPQIRQPRADETVCGPAASPENPLTKTYHTSDQQTTIVNYEKYIKSIHTGKQVSHHGGGTWLYRQQGRRHHGRFPGHTAGSIFGIIRRI